MLLDRPWKTARHGCPERSCPLRQGGMSRSLGPYPPRDRGNLRSQNARSPLPPGPTQKRCLHSDRTGSLRANPDSETEETTYSIPPSERECGQSPFDRRVLTKDSSLPLDSVPKKFIAPPETPGDDVDRRIAVPRKENSRRPPTPLRAQKRGPSVPPGPLLAHWPP